MTLTEENYFSIEMSKKYMSTSQLKNFAKCGVATIAKLNNEYKEKEKDCFIEGHLFESIVNNELEKFKELNPHIFSSRGATKGELKSNFKRVITASEYFKKQKLFTDAIKDCETQVLVTGVINKVKFKGLLDYFNPKTYAFYDTKLMSDFKDSYNKHLKAYEPWYENYGYNIQMAIYQELISQTYKCAKADINAYILGVTKEEIPDVMALKFNNDYLTREFDGIKDRVSYFDKMKNNKIKPTVCYECDYCKSIKILEDFYTVNI